ncbi:hypothetical protein OOZ19_20085 [Saccharopolyspora sp. NFXS83]|nr:hypothetical protein [Saccharopolyspora sp. NFXS83]MCX2732544.1 hypothetical protein [Saccharopolyspora sp. NFXS83]
MALGEPFAAHRLQLARVAGVLSGRVLFTRFSTDCGSTSRAAARSRLFSLPSKLFIAHGALCTYSTRQWSQNGTRTSRPTAMLMRSLRSSSARRNRARCTWLMTRIRAFPRQRLDFGDRVAVAVASGPRQAIVSVIASTTCRFRFKSSPNDTPPAIPHMFCAPPPPAPADRPLLEGLRFHPRHFIEGRPRVRAGFP